MTMAVFFFLAGAVLCFALAFVLGLLGVPTGRASLTDLGLAFFAAAFLVPVATALNPD